VYTTVVATYAVVTHARMIDVSAHGERASACSSSVTAVKTAPGQPSNTRSQILPSIIAEFGSSGATGSCASLRPIRQTSTPGLRHVTVNATSHATASAPRCFVMATLSMTCDKLCGVSA
jgi:hypothetical protein